MPQLTTGFGGEVRKAWGKPNKVADVAFSVGVVVGKFIGGFFGSFAGRFRTTRKLLICCLVS